MNFCIQIRICQTPLPPAGKPNSSGLFNHIYKFDCICHFWIFGVENSQVGSSSSFELTQSTPVLIVSLTSACSWNYHNWNVRATGQVQESFDNFFTPNSSASDYQRTVGRTDFLGVNADSLNSYK